MTTPNPSELFSPFLPSTFNLPEEEDRIRDFLGETFSEVADVVNQKKIGSYTSGVETQNGEVWGYINPQIIRNGFQTFVFIPSWVSQTITLNTIPTFPISNIDPNFMITHVWASATKRCSKIGAGDGDYFSFYSQGDARIQFTMSDLQIVITAAGTSAYSGFIVIEYLRRGFG